jgi:hypothetical protein
MLIWRPSDLQPGIVWHFIWILGFPKSEPRCCSASYWSALPSSMYLSEPSRISKCLFEVPVQHAFFLYLVPPHWSCRKQGCSELGWVTNPASQMLALGREHHIYSLWGGCKCRNLSPGGQQDKWEAGWNWVASDRGLYSVGTVTTHYGTTTHYTLLHTTHYYTLLPTCSLGNISKGAEGEQKPCDCSLLV